MNINAPTGFCSICKKIVGVVDININGNVSTLCYYHLLQLTEKLSFQITSMEQWKKQGNTKVIPSYEVYKRYKKHGERQSSKVRSKLR
jgi:hypothetical protein